MKQIDRIDSKGYALVLYDHEAIQSDDYQDFQYEIHFHKTAPDAMVCATVIRLFYPSEAMLTFEFCKGIITALS